jgi:hypothetical protein
MHVEESGRVSRYASRKVGVGKDAVQKRLKRARDQGTCPSAHLDPARRQSLGVGDDAMVTRAGPRPVRGRRASVTAQRDQQTGDAEESGDPESEHPAQQLGTHLLELGAELEPQAGDLCP